MSEPSKPKLTENEIRSVVVAELCDFAEELGGTLVRISMLVCLYGAEQKQGHERVTSAQLLTICHQLASIVKLCRPLSSSSIVSGSISRAVYEACLLGSYVLTDPIANARNVELYTTAFLFSSQQTNCKLSNGKRFIVSNGYKMSRNDPKVKEALDLYMSKGGKLRQCFSLDRVGQIDAISKKNREAGLRLSLVEESTYRDLSELVHATFTFFESSQIERTLRGEQSFVEGEVLRAVVVCAMSIEAFIRMIRMFYGPSPLLDSAIELVNEKLTQIGT